MQLLSFRHPILSEHKDGSVLVLFTNLCVPIGEKHTQFKFILLFKIVHIYHNYIPSVPTYWLLFPLLDRERYS